jgi:hypothetical protein
LLAEKNSISERIESFVTTEVKEIHLYAFGQLSSVHVPSFKLTVLGE